LKIFWWNLVEYVELRAFLVEFQVENRGKERKRKPVYRERQGETGRKKGGQPSIARLKPKRAIGSRKQKGSLSQARTENTGHRVDWERKAAQTRDFRSKSNLVTTNGCS